MPVLAWTQKSSYFIFLTVAKMTGVNHCAQLFVEMGFEAQAGLKPQSSHYLPPELLELPCQLLI
jgi:hypothetical protein